MRMFTRTHLTIVAALGLLVIGSARPAWALAGTLDKPSIAIPTKGEGAEAQQDPVCVQLHQVLTDHAKQFVTGQFINAHTTMDFGGKTEELNKLLAGLAAVDGARLHIRFTDGNDETAAVTGLKRDVQPGVQWRISHNAWAGDAHGLSITIYVGDGQIKIGDVQIPTIIGEKPAATADEFKLPAQNTKPVEKKP